MTAYRRSRLSNADRKSKTLKPAHAPKTQISRTEQVANETGLETKGPRRHGQGKQALHVVDSKGGWSRTKAGGGHSNPAVVRSAFAHPGKPTTTCLSASNR